MAAALLSRWQWASMNPVRKVIPWQSMVRVPAPTRAAMSELKDPVENSADGGLISDEQEFQIVNTGFILRARRRGTPHPVWVAVEISNKVHSSDISRALESAHTLATVFGEEAIPVTAGYAIAPRTSSKRTNRESYTWK